MGGVVVADARVGRAGRGVNAKLLEVDGATEKECDLLSVELALGCLCAGIKMDVAKTYRLIERGHLPRKGAVHLGKTALASLVVHVDDLTILARVGDVRVDHLIDAGAVVVVILKSSVLAEFVGRDQEKGVLGVRIRVRGRLAKRASMRKQNQ